MNFIEIAHPQRSPEWLAARAGRLTSTAIKDMLATVQKGEAAVRRDLRVRLVVERLTGQPQETGYINAEMQRGIDKEPEARALYEAVTGHLVQTTGFLQHTELMAGASLDGHIGDWQGLVELKAPKSATHLSYLRNPGRVPAEHLPQLSHALWLTGAPWVDFVSFDDRFPAPLQLFIVRLEASAIDLGAHDAAVRAFLKEIDAELVSVQALMERAA